MAQAVKKQAMGRGLSALLKDPENDIKSISDKNADKVVGSIIELDLEFIEINPFQPRTNFNEESLNELGISIKELGVIQPITVRKMGFNKYQLISGERRLRASKLIGLKTIPAYIRLADDNESLVMALVENIQRHDLDSIEIALSYQRLIDELQLTQEQVSDKVGKKRSTVANYLRLLKLDPIIQTGIRDGFISMGHGRALINIDNQEEQSKIYQKIVSENLSVRETEALVKNYQEKIVNPDINLGDIDEKSKINGNIFVVKNTEKTLINNFFKTIVDVKVAKNGTGKISIPFENQIDFERIMNLIKA